MNTRQHNLSAIGTSAVMCGSAAITHLLITVALHLLKGPFFFYPGGPLLVFAMSLPWIIVVQVVVSLVTRQALGRRLGSISAVAIGSFSAVVWFSVIAVAPSESFWWALATAVILPVGLGMVLSDRFRSESSELDL